MNAPTTPRSLYQVDDLSKVYINPTGESRAKLCEMKWATHSLLGVDKRRGPSTDDRDRGKAMHVLIDSYVRRYALTGVLFAFNGEAGEGFVRDIVEQLSAEEGIEIEEYMCHELLAAVRYVLPKLELEKFTVEFIGDKPLVELDLRAVIGNVPRQAIVDAVLRHKVTGDVWVVDWKTTIAAIDTAATPNYTEHDPQLALQRAVLEANNVKVDRAALVQVRSFAPEPPAMTTRGKKLTRNLKLLSCDAQTYRDALIANGEDPYEEKTAAKLKQLERCVYVRWLPDCTNEAGHAAMLADMQQRGERLMEIARGERQPLMSIRNVTGHQPYNGGCKRCDYHAWCIATVRNGGVPDLSLVGVAYKRNDKATFTAVDGRTPTPASDVYAEYTKAYGAHLAVHEVFVP